MSSISKNNSKKFGVISHSLPPSPTGQAIMLFRLLQEIKPDKYFLVSKEDYSNINPADQSTQWLPTHYYCIKKKYSVSNFPILRFFDKNIKRLFDFWGRFILLSKIAKKENCKVLVACSGAELDIIIGFLVSKLKKIKFVPYVFDDYVYQWVSFRRRFFITIVTPIILKYSENVIVPNEFLQDNYKKRYHIIPVVIHNSYSVKENEIVIPWPSEPGKIKIVYSGSIYDAQYDAFIDLLDALRILNCKEIELDIYTPQLKADLEKNGINGEFNIHPFMNSMQINKIQQNADILFLPLAFHSPYPKVIRTSAPVKMGEYLASGQPILDSCSH